MKPDRLYPLELEYYPDEFRYNNKKERELYRFYLYDKTKEEKSRLSPFLYAYTSDKEISEKFKLTRNPDLFVYKHSKEPFEMIADIEHKHPGTRLRRTALKSRSPKDPTKSVEIPMILTCDEERKVLTVQDDLYPLINMTKCMEDMTPLSTELNDALRKLGYFDIYRYLNQMQYVQDELSYFYAGVAHYNLEPSVMINIVPDEFSLFMLMYGNTLQH